MFGLYNPYRAPYTQHHPSPSSAYFDLNAYDTAAALSEARARQRRQIQAESQARARALAEQRHWDNHPYAYSPCMLRQELDDARCIRAMYERSSEHARVDPEQQVRMQRVNSITYVLMIKSCRKLAMHRKRYPETVL